MHLSLPHSPLEYLIPDVSIGELLKEQPLHKRKSQEFDLNSPITLLDP